MKDKIYVFTLDGCAYCTFLKNKLNDLNIPFTEIEVTVNEHLWDQVVKQTGLDNLPTVYIQKENKDTGPVYVPDRDFNNQDEIIEIIKNHLGLL
jgi:glutaredoxin